MSLMQLDNIDNGDGTPTDDFYIDMIRGMWEDMREDVEAMMKARTMDPNDTAWQKEMTKPV